MNNQPEEQDKEDNRVILRQIELLEQQIELLKSALCTCFPNGVYIACPIHGKGAPYQKYL